MFDRLFLCSVDTSKGWIAVMNPTSGVTKGRAISVNSSGDVFTIGSWDYAETIFRVNKDCILQWQRDYYPTFGSGLFNSKITLDLNNNVYTNNWTYDYNPRNSVINKYNASGVFQSAVRYVWASNDFYNGEMHSDASNNIYSSHVRDTGDPTYVTFGAILKKDSSLAVSWNRYIGTSGFSGGTEASSVRVGSSGNIYSVGRTDNYDAGFSHLSVLKLNSSGTLLAQQHIAALRNAVIAVDDSDNPIISGIYADGVYSVYLVKMNSSLAVQWERKITLSGTSLFVSGICTDQSGNVYVSANGGNNTYILKYNGSGVLQWQRTINTTGADGISGIAHDKKKSFYVVGETTVSGSARLFFAKLPHDGTATGTYSIGGYSYTYSASSLIDSASSLGTVSATLTLNTMSVVQNTNSLFADRAGTATLVAKTL